MADRARIREIEAEIDQSFAAGALPQIGYAQAIWTLLCFMEDRFLKALNAQQNQHDMRMFADVWLNALSHPIRVCFTQAPEGARLQCSLIDEHYRMAWQWTDAARDYDQFCIIFPLWYRHLIQLTVEDHRLLIADTEDPKREYEAYNRLIAKEGRPDPDFTPIPEEVARRLSAATKLETDGFYIKFNPKLVSALVSWLAPIFGSAHTLPDDWEFNGFTLSDYRTIHATIQSMLFGWHHVKMDLAASGMPGLGYRSSVWIVAHDELQGRLERYTKIASERLLKILDLLTFGSNEIRTPDIAVQPLIDLRNGFYALSPFVWLSSAAERNLCVLLNQIPEQKAIYADLTNQKEAATRSEITSFLADLGFDFLHGPTEGTNVDLAIIDHAHTACLVLELKWFIEPAEIREVVDRTEELAKGVTQAKVINKLFAEHDERLMKNLLRISPKYSFLSVVASQNWIGYADVQDDEIPIVKESGSLVETMRWAKEREYLPIMGKDDSVVPFEISCGGWKADWYGLRPVDERA